MIYIRDPVESKVFVEHLDLEVRMDFKDLLDHEERQVHPDLLDLQGQ